MEKKAAGKNPAFQFALKKVFIIIAHLLSLALFVTGVSLIYCNENFKKGIRWMNTESFEDSPAFSDLFESTTKSLFDYVRYRDVFETKGKLDTSKEMFNFDISPGTEQSYTLDDVMEYAGERGYYLDNNYRVVANPGARTGTAAGTNESYAVNWRAYNSTSEMKEPGDAYMTLDALTVETLTCLGKYYSAEKKLNTGNTNFYYNIIYDSTSYANLPSLKADAAKRYGRYVICTSDSVLPENNLPSTPTSLLKLIVSNNPDKNSNGSYSAFIALDTAYPKQDEFYIGSIHYARQRNTYFLGLVLLISGLLIMLISLILLLRMSGHAYRKSKEIRLLRSDRFGPEANVLICALMIIVCLFLSDQIGKRLLHIMIPQTFWAFSTRMLSYVIIYLCVLAASFSIIREAKAGILWKNSSLKHLVRDITEFFHDISYSRRLSFRYGLYLLGNVILVSLATCIILRGRTLTSRFAAIAVIVLFCLFNIFIFRKRYRSEEEIDKISEAIKSIAEGNTDYQLDLSEFSGKEADMAHSINNIGKGLQAALNEQVKSERMKAELITNVSHDIKTPLTSIINYVDLIKREHPEDPKIREYLDVLDQKSQHLKTLTEDLVEASKASTGNIALDAADIDFVELVEQTNGEFEERYKSSGLELLADLPKKAVLIRADGQHLWRVLENLYSNACKYAARQSRVYVNMREKDGSVTFTIKNVSARELNISPDELTERFVRGDVSRTTEGSGLGLSIAKSLTELQGGVFRISIDGDLFKADVTFPVISSGS